MFTLLNQQESEFDMLSTALINHGPRGWIDYLQRRLCPRMNRTSLETTKLLLNQLDPEYKTRENMLLASVGNMAVRLMLQLIDEDLIVFQDSGRLEIRVRLMQERGITSKGMAFCTSHNAFWNIVLQGYCELMQEDMQIPHRTLVEAASNEEEGYSIIRNIFRGDDSWLQDTQFLSQMTMTAAASGQVELLNFIFERCTFLEPERADLLAIASLYNAVKQNDEETIIQLLADGTEPDIPNFYGHTPLWQACVRGHTSVARRLLGTGAVEIECLDRWHRTVLHWAAALNHRDIVELLLEHGADPDQEDLMGLTPLKLAQRWSALETKSVLQDLEREKLLISCSG